MSFRPLVAPLVAVALAFACGSDATPTPNLSSTLPGGNAGAPSGSAGSTGLPSAEEDGVLPTSGLPLVGAQGVTQPSGTAGDLQVLDWAGFKAAVTYTFDDSNRSQIKHYAELQALGVPMSFYLITSKPESLDPVWKQALLDGHEVANHTKSHLQMGDAIAADTDDGNTFLESTFSIKVYTMAAPYGTAAYGDVARTRYLINRGTGNAQIPPNGTNDPFNLNCFIPPANLTAAEPTGFNSKVDAVRATGSWQVMLVHGFTDMDATEGAFQPVDFNEFASGVNYAKNFGDVWIDSLVNVGAYWLGERSFKAAAPVTEGRTTTWSWTLPDHFPPGKYLRVTTNGGELRQDGKNLAWDPHGYYEIALDAKSLTLVRGLL
jgi:peptidoglycan/xylan/chitin deacetylase (PgdA/CDA1 family)